MCNLSAEPSIENCAAQYFLLGFRNLIFSRQCFFGERYRNTLTRSIDGYGLVVKPRRCKTAVHNLISIKQTRVARICLRPQLYEKVFRKSQVVVSRSNSTVCPLLHLDVEYTRVGFFQSW